MLSADEANRRYFREAYRTGEHGWPADEPSPYAVEHLRRASDRVSGGRLLDLGCGEGRHAAAAARLGFRAVGLDYEPLALEAARRKCPDAAAGRIALVQADALRLPFRDACFDVLLDYGCLHHQKKEYWPRYRRNLLRVLKPRGFFVLTAFSPRFRMFRGSARRWHIAQGAYRRCFTREEIPRLFGADFHILELREERGPDGGLWHALMRRR